jgi:hypothetical protein
VYLGSDFFSPPNNAPEWELLFAFAENKKTTELSMFLVVFVILPFKEADRTGLEPATSAVTGRHSNQLNYRSGIEGAKVYHFSYKHKYFLKIGLLGFQI